MNLEKGLSDSTIENPIEEANPAENPIEEARQSRRNHQVPAKVMADPKTPRKTAGGILGRNLGQPEPKKLDDGWPESVEEQGLLLLVWRHHITKQYIKDVL